MAETIKKTSTKIWLPIIEKFDQKMEAACLRRDAYLNNVIERELDYLDEEVSLPNSVEAHGFVAHRLDQLNRKLVSLALRPDLVERLNEICRRKRIVRDAFFNRLFLLLAAKPALVDHLFFPDFAKEWRTEVWSENKNDGPFFQNIFYPLEQDFDPFWAIRAGIDLYLDETELQDYTDPDTGAVIRVKKGILGEISPLDSLYTTVLGEHQLKDTDLTGFNCYMPDWNIPGHKSEEKMLRHLDELLLDFGKEGTS